MSKGKLQIASFIILFTMFCLAISVISIAGVHFRYTSMTWTQHGWGALGATELACIIYIWLILALGTAAFISLNTCCLILFFWLDFLSICFTFGIVVFCFIGAMTSKWDERLGCNSKYNGLWKAWEAVDIYLQAADSLLCSSRCPCYFNSTTTSLFSSDSLTMPYISQWRKRDKRYGNAVRIQECPKDVIADVYNLYLMRNAYYNHTLRPDWFNEYYRHVEEYFKCTGFCGTTYYDENKRTSQKIVKYLFSDISRGIPQYNGCLPQLLNWITKTLNAFAGISLFILILQICLFWIAVYLWWTNRPEYEQEMIQEKLAKELLEQKREKKEIYKPKHYRSNKQKEKEFLKKKKQKEIKEKKRKDEEQSQMIELGNIEELHPEDLQRDEVGFN